MSESKLCRVFVKELHDKALVSGDRGCRVMLQIDNPNDIKDLEAMQIKSGMYLYLVLPDEDIGDKKTICDIDIQLPI